MRCCLPLPCLFTCLLLLLDAVAGATGAEEQQQQRRQHHQVQHGKCSYTFILPQEVGEEGACGGGAGGGGVGVETSSGGATGGGAGKQQVSNALQRDSPPPPDDPHGHSHSQGSPTWQESKLQALESITDNNTQWLHKLESYIQENVCGELQEKQKKTLHTHTAAMLEISTNLLSHSTEQTRKLMDVETQVLNHTSRVEVQLLEVSVSTSRLEKLLLLQANELARLNERNRLLEQRLSVMEAGHAEELRAAQQEKKHLQTLLGMSALPRDEPMLSRDCAEIYKSGVTQSGVYTIRLPNTTHTLKVWCDMDTMGGGWTVLQKRHNGSVDFHRTWREYKQGFGSVLGEHWLGNAALHRISWSQDHSLLVLLRDADGHEAHALYQHFHIADEEKNYSLHWRGFSGTAGKTSSLTRSGTMFSTRDRDHDLCSCKCAQMATGGWWFEACGPSNLNGVYYGGVSNGGGPYGGGVSKVAYNSIKWYYWRGPSLRATMTTMMLRPADF